MPLSVGFHSLELTHKAFYWSSLLEPYSGLLCNHSSLAIVSALDVDLMQFQIFGSGHDKNGLDGSKLGNGCKCVQVVDTWYLRKSLDNKTHLVPYDITCSILLRAEDPFCGRKVGEPDKGLVACIQLFLLLFQSYFSSTSLP